MSKRIMGVWGLPPERFMKTTFSITLENVSMENRISTAIIVYHCVQNEKHGHPCTALINYEDHS